MHEERHDPHFAGRLTTGGPGSRVFAAARIATV
jgi:hypothetical protein